VKRSKGLRPRSEKRQAFEDELDAITPALLARSGGMCEICGTYAAAERHHRLRRSQGGGNELDNLLHLCPPCHGIVHAYPVLSYEHGWLLRNRLTFPQAVYRMGT
jgi:5-methylcytosine-specific restriction endonuclease McrA